MPASGPPDFLARLRTALTDAIRARDRIATSALRSVLSAIANAEAITLTETVADLGAPGTNGVHVAGAVAGLGATEASRRALTTADIDAIVQTEITDRLAAARDYDNHNHPDQAQRLRHEARAITSALAHNPPPTT